jgi:hypothetical protein
MFLSFTPDRHRLGQVTLRALAGSASTATVVALVAVSGVGASAIAALPPVSKPCPKAATINRILGQHARPPVKRGTLRFGETCTYPGTAPISAGLTTITFQTVTPSEFASVERIAIASTPGVTKLKGLGQAAWATNAGLHVLDGREEIDV